MDMVAPIMVAVIIAAARKEFTALIITRDTLKKAAAKITVKCIRPFIRMERSILREFTALTITKDTLKKAAAKITVKCIRLFIRMEKDIIPRRDDVS